MIYKLEPLDRTIFQIINDLGLGQEDVPYGDFVEWIAAGLQQIGSYYQMRDKKGLVVIHNYEGELPCDFDKMILIEGSIPVLGKSIGGIYAGSLQAELECKGAFGITESEVTYPDGSTKEVFHLDTMGPYDRYNTLTHGLNTPDMRSKFQRHLVYNGYLIGNNHGEHSDFKIEGNKITSGMQHGYLEIYYQALPIDDRGFPLIPDNQSFRDALFWKVAYHLCLRDPDIFKNPQLKDLRYTKGQWNFYCVQARAEANMPDEQGMARLANNWLDLLKPTHLHLHKFKGLGEPSHLNLTGRR